MRSLIVLLVLLSLIHAADNETPIKRYLNLGAEATCPGNILQMNATSSDGLPAYDVELRLVLYLPYQGLRAIAHTGEDGLASVQLTKNGSYRIYINTDKYNHEKYVEFDYPALCPPPPPQEFLVNASADCESNLTLIRVSKSGAPLPGVFVWAENWSTVTGQGGVAVFPLMEGQIYIRAAKENFSSKEFYSLITCAPPLECYFDSDCPGDAYCNGGTCFNISGECGYPLNHTWVLHQCCMDSDCGDGFNCADNTCFVLPPPEQNISIGNITENATNHTAEPEDETADGACAAAALLGFISLIFAAR